MKSTVFKTLFFAIVLVLSLIVFETVMNKGNTDMTAEMSSAAYPLVYMNVSGERVNCLRGYRDRMDTAFMRETITPVGLNRELGIEVQEFDSYVTAIRYEVRSSDGSRLIEDTELKDVKKNGTIINAHTVIKDLIDPEEEYSLVVICELSTGQQAYYYTRLIQVEDYHVAEKIRFVERFHENTFDKAGAADNLVQYLESDRTGNNSDFRKVNIHSNLDQVTWGNLRVKVIGDPVIDIKEMMEQTASFQIGYRAEIGYEGGQSEYRVTEYYRIRYTEDRVYLLDFEREMSQIFMEQDDIYTTNKIFLGVQNQEKIQLKECEGGGIIALTVDGKLITYNESEKKIATVFGFYDADNFDDRTLYDGHDIHILNIDETGNVDFVVFGYMSRGRHEGQNGVQVCSYDSSKNTVEEKVFIESRKSSALLRVEVGQLSYAGNADRFYMMLDNSVYMVDLEKKTAQIVEDSLAGNNYQISESGKMFAYISGQDQYHAQKMNLLNMQNGMNTEIKADAGKYLMPLGFIGDDLIYGEAAREDVVEDNTGRTLFPMKIIRIQDAGGKVLKEYTAEDSYVLGCRVLGTQIVLNRIIFDAETGIYQEIEDDQIMSSVPEESGKNKVETAVTDVLETICQIALKNDIDTDNLQYLTPRELLFEGENQVVLPECRQVPHYYVYTTHGLTGIYTDAADAVENAYESAGVVLSDAGIRLWYKGNRLPKNQIMKITKDPQMESETVSQLAACLNGILNFEGVNRNSQYMLDQGKAVSEILDENIPDIQSLDLTGCSMDAMLYYVNQDIPVLVGFKNGDAMLLIGFNELNVVVMDPKDGTVYKIGKNDATELFRKNGNRFVTYMYTQR